MSESKFTTNLLTKVDKFCSEKYNNGLFSLVLFIASVAY
jgi:hypothetical protein